MAFNRIKDVVDAELGGQSTFFTWRKTPTQVTTAGLWFDLSMSPGNPVPQYYAASPLTSVRMAKSTDGGLEHGGAVSPYSKRLRKVMVLTLGTGTPMPMILLDYLMFYPFIEDGSTDPQVLTNSTTLSRYTDGEGVQMMAVTVGARTGGQTFSVSYTNSDGVAGRTTPNILQNTSAATGSITSSATSGANTYGPFLPLQSGDTGVRSIESITMNGPDVGLMSLVLVKPLAQLSISGIDAPVEIDYLRDFAQMPEIEDDAYLNFICCPRGSLSGTPIHGYINTIWG